MGSHEMTTSSVLGDLVLVAGPRAADRARVFDGLARISIPGDDSWAAIRGHVHLGMRGDGTCWMALADLVEGEVGQLGGLLDGEQPQRRWRGRFAAVVWNPREHVVAAVTDQFSTLSLYAHEYKDHLIIATDLRLIAKMRGFDHDLDLQAIYHYFNFGHIPAPRTIFSKVHRLEPGIRMTWRQRHRSQDRYYLPDYPEDLTGSDTELGEELRERMIATVRAYRPRDGASWGCFLSGGTDSSSILSILSDGGASVPVRAYSIGFAEQGFDELCYARIATNACGARSNTAVVSSSHSLQLVSRLVEGFDQPFGGASAVGTIACADLAHNDGVGLVLAGDGGDEIFGGNERYAKDRVMEAWYAMPPGVKAAGRALGSALGDSRHLLLNRIDNFFQRAALPNPDRFYTDDSFASDHYETLLTPEFRKVVPRDASLEFLRSVYELGDRGGRLHRVMRLDLLMAIAQHDIRKVHCGAREGGVSVRFPYLDPDLVDYVNRLPERYKVRGLKKRYLFIKAMQGIVPAEILQKKKQGFSMPLPVWLREDPGFRDTVRDTLSSPRARQRGWWNPEFVDRLLAEHQRGSWNHSDYLWRMFVLELWLRRYVDAS